MAAAAATVEGAARRRWRFTAVDFGRSDGLKPKLWLPENEPASAAATTATAAGALDALQIETFNPEVEAIGWTKLETETLLDLHARFHGNVAVVADRWPSSLVARTVLELKERLYGTLPSSLLATAPVDFAQERTRLAQLDLVFQSQVSQDGLAKQRVLEQDIKSLQQQVLQLRMQQQQPRPCPTSKLEQKCLEDRDEDFSSTNCWMRSNLLDPRFLQGVTGAGTAGGGKETMLVLYEVLNLLQVPMDPVPTFRVCDAHGKLKTDTLKLLAFRKQIDKLNKLRVVKTEPVDVDSMFDSVPIDSLKRTLEDSAQSPTSANKKARIT
ncbi:hypothetical protein BASA81_002426 [Batrachochytrium salamandrivorans]|nr:hypothetical protein BASA81_002426 [Batrachochytrium salamandrivorans]